MTKIIAGLVFAICLYSVHLQAPAQLEDVRKVKALAEQSSVARGQYASFLAANPAPSRWELLGLEQDINKTLVADEARSVSGSVSIPEHPLIKGNESEPASELLSYEVNPTVAYAFIMALVVLLSLNFFSYVKNRK